MGTWGTFLVVFVRPNAERRWIIDGSHLPLLFLHSFLEQWGYRSDKRRTKEIWQQKGYDAGEDDNIRPWLADFVNSVGPELPEKLLEGVGQVQ